MATNLLTTNGVEMAQVQTLMKKLRYYDGPIDGSMNFALVGAIDTYQRALGITPAAKHGNGNVGWGIWDETTENATNYLVHYMSGGTRWWARSGGEVSWDPATMAPATSAPVLPPTTPVAQPPAQVIGPVSSPIQQPIITDDAVDRLDRWLVDRYGLSGLRDFSRKWLEEGWDENEAFLELEETDAFKVRFPAIFERRSKGLPSLSPQAYVELERGYASTLQRAGLIRFFDDKSIMSELIGNDVSVAEFQTRVLEGYRRVALSAPEVRQKFAEYFGVDGDTALAAYFLDGDNLADKLLQQTEAAAVGGQAARFGFSVGQTTALDLVQSSGVDERRAQQGFASLAQIEPVFQETLGERQDLDAMREGIAATFQTGQPGVRLIEGRVRARTGMLSGGGGAAASDAGILGFGGQT